MPKLKTVIGICAQSVFPLLWQEADLRKLLLVLTPGELALVVQNLFEARHFEYDIRDQPSDRTAWLKLKLDL